MESVLRPDDSDGKSTQAGFNMFTTIITFGVGIMLLWFSLFRIFGIGMIASLPREIVPIINPTDLTTLPEARERIDRNG